LLTSFSTGIEVLTVEPGYFRTNFLSPGHKIQSQGDAGELSALYSKSTDLFEGMNHKQPGDPKKGSKVIVEALTHSGPWEGAKLPLRLVLGRDAQAFVGDIIDRSKRELDQWRAVTSKTDCDDVVPK
jgi:NAD(P)-dependent dehydrogenase (short-subunit alcohol dehydrogenase family)